MKDDHVDFEKIYDAHSGFIRQVLFRYLGVEDLDDAVQDCFLKIWKARDDFRLEAQLRTWMYKIATNYAFDLLRARSTRGLSVEADLDQFEAAPSRDRSVSRAIDEAVRTLPEEYLAVIVG